MQEYGEIRFLNDTSLIFTELQKEWEQVGDINVAQAFKYASEALSTSADKLNTAQSDYEKRNGIVDPIQIEYQALLKELHFDSLISFIKAYLFNRKQLNKKIDRLNELEKIIHNKESK